jgi:hypothetical protein
MATESIRRRKFNDYIAKCAPVMQTALNAIDGKTSGSVTSAMATATEQMNAVLAQGWGHCGAL